MVKWSKEILEKKGFKITGDQVIVKEPIDRGYFIFNLLPIPKPRMTRRDKWLNPPRPGVARYWKFKDEINRQANSLGFKMPENNFHVIFHIPMPKSWTGHRKDTMVGTKHQQKPDFDNLAKGLIDAICAEDKFIWDARVTKLWAHEGKIEIVIK